jgi:C4-dicarboxylate-specific signal transduction histidine kinase
MTAIALVLLLFAAAALAVVVPERQRVRAALAVEQQRRTLAEASEREFGELVSALPGAIYRGLVDAGNALRPVYVDRSIGRVTGWQWSDDREFAPWHALVDGETRAALRAFLARVARHGHDSLAYRLRRPDGGWIWVRETARVVRRRAFEAEIIGYVEDVTAEREVAAQAQAASKLATLGHMATSLAHELNQPIAVMSLAARNGIARLRADGAAAVPGTLARLERIAAQADRAIEITEQLRIFGHAGNGRTEAVALSTAMRGALLLTNGALQAIGARVTVSVTEDLPPVRARLVPLEQVIVNLLLNARDALEGREPGGRELVIEALPGETPEAALLRITDSGGGIPPEVIGRIFEPFFTTKPVGRGTGLGLSFCFGTMASFGGAIAVRNTAAGAEFTLTFAAAPDHPAETPPSAPAEAPRPADPATT